MENKPLLLFMPIYDDVAEQFVDKMNEVPEDEPLDIWVNSPGGRVFAGWSIIGAMEKRTGKKTVCVMGHAASMAVYFALFADEVEALEVSQFLIHRADGYVDNPEQQAFLDKINKDLRKQMESRLKMDVFETVTGKTLDQIFDPKQRIDLWIDAKQAKKIGLVNKIKKLEPEQIKAYNERFVAFADFEQRSTEDTQRSVEGQQTETNINNSKIQKMTKSEFKSQNPDVHAEIFNEGKDFGVKAEQIRVKSWMAYIDIDKENVITAIKEGKEFTPDIIAEMSVKLAAKAEASKLETDSAGKIATDKSKDKTESQSEVESFEKEVADGLKKFNL